MDCTISILKLIPSRQSGHGRLQVNICPLIKILDKIGNRPVAIISINGKQRSGKSFLATQFIKYLSTSGRGEWLGNSLDGSFQWRNDVDRVTSGIDIWHKPFIIKTNDGKEVGVIVMDTQGLHDSNTGTAENALIFGLSVLLSSVFIYNEKHSADGSLQHLRSFLEFAKLASGGDQKERQLKFQKLIFLFRDWECEDHFSFGYYDDHTCPSGERRNLKEKMFRVGNEMHAEARETRRGIINCFEKIAVYAMCGLGNRRPDKYPNMKDWDPDFVQGIRDFVPKIFCAENIVQNTKKVFGEELTGAELKVFVEKWADLIVNAEGVIESRTVFETTAELFFERKINLFVAEYKTAMENGFDERGIAAPVLEKLHESLVSRFRAEFSTGNMYGGREMARVYEGRLLEKIKGIKNDFVAVNKERLQHKAEQENAETQRKRLEEKVKAKETEIRKERKLRKAERLKAEQRLAEIEKERDREKRNVERERERRDEERREREREDERRRERENERRRDEERRNEPRPSSSGNITISVPTEPLERLLEIFLPFPLRRPTLELPGTGCDPLKNIRPSGVGWF